MYLYPDADQRYRNTGWSESLGTSGTPGTEAATHALGVIQTRPGSRRTQVGVPLSCPRSELSVSDRHPRNVYGKSAFSRPDQIPQMASPQIQPPECYGPNILGTFIHDELQNVGADRSVLAGD